MLNRLNKKGIDNIVATVILVGLVVILLLLAFLWGRNYIEQRIQKQLDISKVETQCNKVSFSVLSADAISENLFLQIENNGGETIGKFTFRVSDLSPVDLFQALNPSDVFKYEVNFEKDISSVGVVTIIPWVQVTNAVFVSCDNQINEAKF
ncbi:MAG: hypothetical protein AABW49_04715 [Nanoarchaeota archaeon]